VTHTQEIGAPFFFVAEQPTAIVIDDDIYLTVPAAVPDFPGKIEAIDIVLSLDHARAIVAQLSTALAQGAAQRDGLAAFNPPRPPSRG